MDPANMKQVAPYGGAKVLDRLRRMKSIETSLLDHLHKCDPQLASPLWRDLPLEIRTMIFEYACAPYEDLSRAYEQEKDWCRPGHRGPLVSSTGLLLACRRAWLETHAMPLRQAEHLAWHDKSTGWGCPWDAMLGPWDRLGTRLTPMHRGRINKLHLVLQYWKLAKFSSHRDRFRELLRTLRPKLVKITVLSSEFLYGSRSSRSVDRVDLRGILGAIEVCDGIVDVFQLELEGRKNRQSTLDMIVAQARQLKGSVKRARSLQASKVDCRLAVVKEPYTWYWPRPRKHECVECVVTELQWENVPQPSIKYGLPRRPKDPDLARDMRRRIPGAVSKWRDLPFPLYQDRVHRHSVEIAHAGELQRRRLFVGQMEESSASIAKTRQRKLLAQQIVAEEEQQAQREWDSNGSLMCFL